MEIEHLSDMKTTIVFSGARASVLGQHPLEPASWASIPLSQYPGPASPPLLCVALVFVFCVSHFLPSLSLALTGCDLGRVVCYEAFYLLSYSFVTVR